MKKLVLFAGVAWLGLVSAGPPDDYEGPREARGGYPPCSARVTDRCIQLHERGVSTPENLAVNAELPRERREAHAAAGGGRVYPLCSARRKDECRQQRVLARRIRMAGERG